MNESGWKLQRSPRGILFRDRSGDGQTVAIEAIAVDPRYQGMHIGKQLLAFAENVALEKGFDDLSLNFWSANQVKSFYEQAGFVSTRQGASKHLT